MCLWTGPCWSTTHCLRSQQSIQSVIYYSEVFKLRYVWRCIPLKAPYLRHIHFDDESRFLLQNMQRAQLIPTMASNSFFVPQGSCATVAEWGLANHAIADRHLEAIHLTGRYKNENIYHHRWAKVTFKQACLKNTTEANLVLYWLFAYPNEPMWPSLFCLSLSRQAPVLKDLSFKSSN